MDNKIVESQHWSHEKLLRFAGMFTWMCVGIPLLITPFHMGDGLDLAKYLVWWVAYIGFGMMYWTLAQCFEGRHGGQKEIVYLMVLSACSLIISQASESGLGGFLNIVIAGALPWFVRVRIGVVWVILINLLLWPVFTQYEDVGSLLAVLATALFLGFSGFMFVTSLVGLRQYKARDELRQLNAQLRATQALLTESTRVGERLRISRELHDLVGHHLTALSLNLEVANHLVTGNAAEHVNQAQSLARLLLADVREVVSNLRDDDNLDLKKALGRLVEGVPVINVHLNVSEALRISDPERAHVLLRVVQELITNSVKHSSASDMWISLQAEQDKISLHVKDNGRGGDANFGNGLRGIEERIAHYDGTVSIRTAVGKGFSAQVYMPVEIKNQ